MRTGVVSGRVQPVDQEFIYLGRTELHAVFNGGLACQRLGRLELQIRVLCFADLIKQLLDDNAIVLSGKF